jgi:phosphohistidine swiveling domain-containing protein
MRGGILDLDDPACRDVEVAGAKAAALSQARSLGLPALPGYVVTTSAAAPALTAGVVAVTDHGSGGARRAVQSSSVSEELRAGLVGVVGELGAPVIVRSSATVEGSGEWSGAFSSFADVDAATVTTATKGCWASLFGVDTLERAEHCGVHVGDIGMAALIQPMVSPQVSGHARLTGEVAYVTAVRGAPAGLMSGWVSGSDAVVTAAGEVTGAALGLLAADQIRAVADLTRRCQELLDHRTVEWAVVHGEVVLLQSAAGRRTAEPLTAPGIARLDDLEDPVVDRIADLARRFPGGISEELVLPWATGVRDPRLLGDLGAGPGRLRDLDDLRRQATALAERVWADSDRPAPWQRALRDLRGDRPAASLRLIAGLRPPPVEQGLQLLRDLLTLGAHAAARGSLRRAEEIFGCEPADLEPGRALRPRQSWAGARPWEPFLAGVAQTRGTSVAGMPGAPGVGAGGVRVVEGIDTAGHATFARSVIVATHPVPALSPLLWNAAGLVTTRGSHGAHLLEVAHSLGVPAVVQCRDLPIDRLTPESIVAVDGERGQVAWHVPAY